MEAECTGPQAGLTPELKLILCYTAAFLFLLSLFLGEFSSPSKMYSVAGAPLNQSLPTSVTVLVSLKELGLRTWGQEAYAAGKPRK